jgi:hypothetical protein
MDTAASTSAIPEIGPQQNSVRANVSEVVRYDNADAQQIPRVIQAHECLVSPDNGRSKSF